MNQIIIETLGSTPSPKQLAQSLDLLRRFDDNELFNTLFYLSIRRQGIGLPVAYAAVALNALNPQCPITPTEAIEALLSEWDISIEEVVFYLGKQFGRDESFAVLEKLRSTGPSKEKAVRLKTIAYWLNILPEHLQKEKRMAAVAYPPTADEHEITEYDRFLWMLRSYLRKPINYVRVPEDGSNKIIYCDPDGNAWCLVMPKVESIGARPYLCRYDGALIGEDNLEVRRPLA